MLRTAFTLLVMAVLSMSAANGSPAPLAKAHSSARAAVTSHEFKKNTKKTHHTVAVKAGHATGHTARQTPVHEVVRKTGPGSRRGLSRRNVRKQQATAEPASLHGRRVALPAPLVGSYESLARQNDKTEDDDLERIEDEDDLADRIARKVLVPVPASASLTVNGDLPESHRYCRPWTARFLADLAKVHATLFHKPLEVSSAVRTVDYQKQLMQTNGNAAAAEGDVVSPHVTGATVDIAKLGLSRQEMGWMRSWLLPLQQAGKIDVEEEFQQACFHITVYKSYVPPKPAVKAGPARAGRSKTRHSTPGQGAAGQGKATQETRLPPPASADEIASRGR
jgi:hypothetical protein